MTFPSHLLCLLLAVTFLPSGYAACETQLGSMQQCLLASGSDDAPVDAEACVACLAEQQPETTSLDCIVNYNFVCTLADVCRESCGESCNDEIETFGFCTSETFFRDCPQDCSTAPDSGTPGILQNQTCTVFFNQVVSCLASNSGNSVAAPANSESCRACVDARPPPSSGDCAVTNDFVCTVASECYQDCGSVCNDELFTFLQCQGDDVAGEQCTYDLCDDTGALNTNGSNATMKMSRRALVTVAILIMGSVLL